MATSKKLQLTIRELKLCYERLRRGKESLLRLLDESELPELVYNSNAIENSTLTLKETERILLELQTERKISVRELFEAKNLARVTEYLISKPHQDLDEGIILLLHEMLLNNINDRIAGRFRNLGEYVRVGSHVAPSPEHIEALIRELLEDYAGSHERYFLDNIARFHLEFERIHPFVDGNGRIGRVLINWQLAKQGYPPVIIRNKSKHEDYYPVFPSYINNASVQPMSILLSKVLRESLHRRISYLEGRNIVRLVDWAKNKNMSPSSQLNAAKRQTIPAFREKGVWKIAV